MADIRATIVIPTYNRDFVLLDTIESCLAQRVKVKLIIADQSDEENIQLKDWIAKQSQRNRISYYWIKPASVTAAKNFALQRVDTPIVIFIDDDVILSKEFVREHLAILDSKEDVAAVAGRVKQKGFPTQGPILHFDKYAVSRGIFNSRTEGYTNSFPGGNVALWTDIARSVGGFDTRFSKGAFREESIFAYKVHRAGHKIFYSHKPWLLHLAAPRGGNRIAKNPYDSWHFYRNELFFTLYVVRSQNLLKALKIKYRTYCRASRRRLPARSIMFGVGLLVAVKRMFFDRQICAGIR